MATNKPTSKMHKDLEALVHEGLEARVTKMFDEQKAAMVKEFSERLELERDKIIAACALQINRQFNMQSIGEQLVITIVAPKVNR